MSNTESVSSAAARAKNAAPALSDISARVKNELLKAIAERIEHSGALIEKANASDMARAADKPQAFLDRLRFDGQRIRSAADGLRKLAELPDPVGRVIDDRTLYNGLRLKKTAVPFGAIAVVYEARPNVTVDAAGLCLKSSNAAVLRGSNDALATNRALVGVIGDVLSEFDIDRASVTLVECGHEGVVELLTLDGVIDLAIPRGSAELIRFVRRSATVPVIETGAGNCTAYIDKSADIALAEKVVLNAKTQRLGVCNALEGLVIDRAALDKALPVLDALKKAGVTLHGDGEIRKIFPAAVAATEDDYYKEYLSLDISVKTVDGVKDAVEYVNKYGSHHSETIIATDRAAVEYFGKYADSAVVYANASTRFTDGFEFGLGAEIGISTQKLHARGPMGIYEMVTYKYLVEGDGQIRR